jgi:hypothetical protein
MGTPPSDPKYLFFLTCRSRISNKQRETCALPITNNSCKRPAAQSCSCFRVTSADSWSSGRGHREIAMYCTDARCPNLFYLDFRELIR